MKEHLSETITRKAVQQFGSPLYVYDKMHLEKRFIAVRKLLSEQCDIFYSLKANPTVAISQCFKKLGAGCEVSSLFELQTALVAGFSPDEIIFVGPGKKKHEIDYAIDCSIRYLVCENIDEVLYINVSASKKNKIVPVLLRVNPDFLVVGAPIKMSGVASQFGLDKEALAYLSTQHNTLKNITIAGIQIYNASRILHEEAILKNIRQILLLAQTVSKTLDTTLEVIDIGGGLGVPYYANENPLNITHLFSKINQLLLEYSSLAPKTRFIMELGRFLIAESGCFATEVQYIKKSHDKHFLVVDGGFNNFLAASAIGSYVHRNFPMRHIAMNRNIKSSFPIEYQVCGPLCTPGDVLLKNIFLSNVSIGDLIVLDKTGAYGLTASASRFISHGAPAEVLIDQHEITLIRKKESLNDLLSTQIYQKKEK